MSAIYDIEDESILSTVFKDAFPESWRGNAEFGQYLSELSSYGVDKLNREPDRLAEERAQILEQTQDLAFHNYKTFIRTAECSKEIFQDFQVIERHVDSLLAKLPNLNKECAHFLKQAQEINTSWKMNSLTLQRHTQLLEVLEIPQLMDTCVRNAYYEEALELAAHVKRLEKKHAQIPVIQNIVKEVKNSSQLMLNQLLHQLRSNIQLPACLRVIGYLRRMDVFTEAELRMKFLQARDAWFQNILANIPNDDAYYHITKVIEASRVHLFDIITQYRAIFTDDDPLLTSNNEASLFHGWVVHKISQFLNTLQSDLLTHGIGGRLDSVLGQSMYFGLSFSRVGADFRALLAPIFVRAVLQEFTQAINLASARFDETMQSYTLLGSLSTGASTALTLASQTSSAIQPPCSLLEFTPLAVYTNDVLMAFNELRLCAPLTLAFDISYLIEESLMKMAQSIVDYHRAEESTFNAMEVEKFCSFCRVFAEDLVPFLDRCLHVLFPPSQVAQLLELHLTDLSKLGLVGALDKDSILQPIDHLLPAKPSKEAETEQTDREQDEAQNLSGESAKKSESTIETSQSEDMTQTAPEVETSSQSEDMTQTAPEVEKSSQSEDTTQSAPEVENSSQSEDMTQTASEVDKSSQSEDTTQTAPEVDKSSQSEDTTQSAPEVTSDKPMKSEETETEKELEGESLTNDEVQREEH